MNPWNIPVFYRTTPQGYLSALYLVDLNNGNNFRVLKTNLLIERNGNNIKKFKKKNRK